MTTSAPLRRVRKRAAGPILLLAGVGAVVAAVVFVRGRQAEGSPTPVDGLPHL
ncbi:hypothetical protein [Mycolicibacterium sp. XJ1819]